MSLGKKLLVSALIAAAVVIVASAVVVALPNVSGYNSSAIQTSQQNTYGYNQRSSYCYGYGRYGYGGCMGGGGYREGTYGGGMGYYPNRAATSYVDLVEITGTLEETHWSYIVLDVDGEALNVYGPSWFWHIINPTTGSNVLVVGKLVSIINGYGETHTEITPYELTIDGITYGNANLGIPVWNQQDI